MKSILILALALMSVGGQAKTTVTNNIGQYPDQNLSTIKLTGVEAKKIWDFLSESQKYTGSFVTEDAAMGKVFLSAPGVRCRAFNSGHLEVEDRNLENIYSCSIEFGSNGAIKL